MNSIDIRADIARAGTSQAAIARFLGISPEAVSRVVLKRARSLRVETEIEKVVGYPLYPTPPKKGRRRTEWNGAVATA
jgi:DNA-binding Lrp family transcriptional regulator